MLRSPTSASLATGFATLALGIGASAYAGGNELFTVRPGLAPETVLEWGRQSHMNVLFDPTVLAGVRTRGIVGTFPPLEALCAMLRDTPLSYHLNTTRRWSVAVAPTCVDFSCWPRLPEFAPLPPCFPGDL